MSDSALIKLFEVGDPRAVALLKEAAEQAKKLETSEEALAKAAGLTAKEYAKVAAEAEKAASNQTTLSQRLSGGWTEFKSKVDLLVGSFQALHAAANTVVELATEQERLDRVQTRLGLNFQAASRAASLYVSETQLATAAARMHAAGLHTTQEQLQALAVVASDYSRNTGDELEQTFDALTQGLIAGEQEGLRRFGPGLARLAGESHDAGERLAELVRTASRIPPVADSATTAWARMNGEMERNARESSRDFVNAFASTQQATRAAQDQMGKDTDVWLGKIAGGLVRFANATAPIIQGIVMPWKLFQGNTWRQVGEALGITGSAASAAAPAVQAHTQALNDNAAAARNAAEWNQRVAEVWAIRPGQDWRSEVSGRPGTGSLGERIAQAERDNAKEAGERVRAETWKRARMAGGTPIKSGTVPTALENLRWSRSKAQRWAALNDTYWTITGQPYMGVDVFRALAGEDIEEAESMVQQARAAANARTDAQQTALAEMQTANLDKERQRLENQRRRQEELRALRESLTPGALGRNAFGFANESEGDVEKSRLQNKSKQMQDFADTAKQAWDALGTSISSNLGKIATGEQGIVEGFKNMATEALKSLGQIAINKGIFYLFEGLASLIFAPAAAANYFAAGAGLTALGIGLSAAGAAKAPSASGAQSSGSTADTAVNARGTEPGSDRGGNSTVVHNYYSPVIQGREATQGDLGDAVVRIERGARSRRVRS